MRLLVTADLHFNHARGPLLCTDIISRMNQAGGDIFLVVGDTAVADGEALEHCLELFDFPGPKLFLCGNHEFWTTRPDSRAVFEEELPRRVRQLGWTWLETDPWRAGDLAIIGTVGWYDYSFADSALKIPRRFYEAKMSPGAAAYLRRDDLDHYGDDVPASTRELVARWNDGKFVRLHQSDDSFLEGCMRRLRNQLQKVQDAKTVVAATHHVPFIELLPKAHQARFKFSRAFLGSGRLGEVLLQYPNVKHLFCGHSHFPARASVGHVDAINIGSSYREKRFVALDLPG